MLGRWLLAWAALAAASAPGAVRAADAAMPAPVAYSDAAFDGAAMPPLVLTDAMAHPVRRAGRADGAWSISYSIERHAPLAQVVAHEAGERRLRSARVVARISSSASLGVAFSDGLDRLVADLRDGSRPRFLVAGDPLDDIGFHRRGQTAFALRQDFAGWGVTVSAEEARPAGDAGGEFAGRVDRRRTAASASRYGLAFDSGFGNLTVAAGASRLTERQTILGARMRDGFGAAHARSLFLDGAIAWQVRPDWRLGAAWRHGVTRSGAIGGTGRDLVLTSNAWAVDVTRSGVFGEAGLLSLRLSQPLRVANDRGVGLPVEYSYETRGDARGATSMTLAPTGREIAAELNWQGPLLSGWATTGVFWRKDPGHLATLRSDHGAAFSWLTRF